MDRLARGIDLDGTIRVVAAVTTELCREASRRHEARGVEAVALGRVLTCACMFATLTKDGSDERARINIRGDGPLGRILADARGAGTVRACLERRLDATTPPERDASGRASIGAFVGRSGQLLVTRDLGLEHQYQGVVELASGEIDEDLERYLEHSEQIPSAMRSEVVLDQGGEVVRAAGVLCQSFPGSEGEALVGVRETLQGGALGELLGRDRSLDELLGFALLGARGETMSEHALAFRCTCGPARARQVVTALGPDELDEMSREREPTEVRCSYCGERYAIAPAELGGLAQRLRALRS
jgi:molecular chaperone Hsp33